MSPISRFFFFLSYYFKQTNKRIYSPLFQNLIPLYAVFCVNQTRTMSFLESHKDQNTPFFQFTEDMMKDPELAGLSLLSYVIKPVQRLCKYPLLLRELLKNTGEGHPDRGGIVSAFEKTQMLVDEVNELQVRSICMILNFYLFYFYSKSYRLNALLTHPPPPNNPTTEEIRSNKTTFRNRKTIGRRTQYTVA